MKKDGLLIDSVIDIAANKVFTIVQQPRGRDYFDLFHIIEKYGFELEKLRMATKQKFDWQIDLLQLAARFNQVSQHLDDPIINKKYNRTKISAFFEDQAMSLKNKIISG